MKKGYFLQTILRSDKTIFTFKDIVLLWQESNLEAARVRLNYYVKNGHLINLRQGIYVKDTKYNKLELATRIYTPSYVSFETVLAKEGVIFQYQSTITVASYVTRTTMVDDQTYSFKSLKNQVLLDHHGIMHENNTSIATKERALLDVLYSNSNFYFDNLRSINWDEVFSLTPLYTNRRLIKQINQLYKIEQSNNK